MKLRAPSGRGAATADPQRHARRRGRLPRLLLASGVLSGLLAGGLLGVREAWPAARILAADPALARLTTVPFGEHVASASVLLGSGRSVAAVLHGRQLDPSRRLGASSRVTVEVTLRRSGWIAWLVGASERVRVRLVTPSAPLPQRFLAPARGSAIELRFGAPVAAVALRLANGRRRVIDLSPPRRVVPLGVRADGASVAGSVLVAASARPWQRAARAVSVSWFAPSAAPELLVRPAPGTTVDPATPIVLTFSRPVAALLGARRPRLWPPTPGAWHEPNAHTLVFQPTGLGLELGAHLRLGLTRRFRVVSGADPVSGATVSWQVAPGSTLRLEQLLSALGYLPFSFRPAGVAPPATPAAEASAAIDPPPGRLAWRYHPPRALAALWASPAQRTVLIQGAVMAFQSVAGLDPSGDPGPALWHALLEAALAQRHTPYGYSYVYVSESLPETLTLWHDGRVVLTTPTNTGIPERPTTIGTFPVYEHLSSTTMTGTNPDGTPYSDPGVPWVNYFYDGEAVHGFIRPGYGYPQSLGCVELPIPTAAAVFPYVQVGTLVTVAA